MPNLVGIGNSQVPTNAMLGGLAYQDSVGEIDIDKIKAKTGDTATDVFVYDTRKDSDGGAWRHRTQKTSWYNEGASATRGARKEFPAVAVIVAETDTLTIYDGDDPNLSMWMVFEANTDSQDLFINDASSTLTSVAALNGRVFAGSTRTSVTGNITGIDFIGDRGGMVYTSSSDIRTYRGGVGHRNDGLGNEASTSNWFTLGTIVNRDVNDVAMTVLPNAPIDAVTELPIPIIALATDGGTNIIYEDGVVRQGYQTIATENVDLHPDGFMTDGISGATNDSFSFYDINKTDRLVSYGHRVDTQVINTLFNKGTGECLFEGKSNKIAIAQSQGLLRIAEEIDIERSSDAVSLGLHNRTASSYNTGWMVADVKGAFMSDTDTTNVTGSELVTNGTFDSDISSWTYTGSGSATHGSGQVTVTGATGDRIYQDISGLTVGETYVLSGQIVSGSTGQISMYQNAHASSGAFVVGSGNISPQTISLVFTAPTTTVNLRLVRVTSTVVYDNISIRKAELDRSANGQPYVVGGVNYSSGQNALAVFGTVTKSAVSTGAELVAYSGFSNTNYLQQAINSDLQFGTGDWAFYGWYDDTGGSGARTIFELGRSTVAGDHIGVRNDGTNLELFISDDSFSSQDVAEFSSSAASGWQFCCALRRGNQIELWNNGVLKATKTIEDAAGDLGDSETYLRFGNRTYTSQPWDGSLALWRVSKTAPTPEQIKKMYYDEKCLFHENAQATLYGTSDAVTALAHDDSNNTLHVGTSAGRSEFQGLTRINNTTTAVTTAISASNGLVAEQ